MPVYVVVITNKGLDDKFASLHGVYPTFVEAMDVCDSLRKSDSEKHYGLRYFVRETFLESKRGVKVV